MVRWLLLGGFVLAWASTGVAADAPASAAALKAFQAALTGAKSLDELTTKDFATVPLTKDDAAKAKDALWQAHVARIQKERAEEMKAKVLKHDKLEMPFAFKTFGKKPEKGWSLWISMHGGGGAPPKVNDGQWENQKRLYTLEEGIYLAPRAPTNTWNLWHEGHIDPLFTRLIENMIVLEGVDPNRVYLMGYSAGGDGVYQLAPRMADQFAAAAMMAGHPNGVPLLSLRNLPFALQVGGNDAAYNRNKVAQEYGDQLAKLHKDDPKGYEHFVKIHEGKPHWMNLEDKVALPWMAKFRRNTVPERIVWKQSGALHDRFYWLAVPLKEAKGGSLVVAERQGQTITVQKVEQISTLTVRLDERLADLEKPIVVKYNGKTLHEGTASRTIKTLLQTLQGRGDPDMLFPAEVTVTIPQ